MRYFLDAEFNGFGGELVSIALVPEEADLLPFYQAIVCAEPTTWVIDNVLPVMEIKPRDRTEVANRFAQYLLHDEYPLLVADWPEDIAHAANLLVIGPGRMKPVRSLRFELVDPDIIGPPQPSEVPHNACHDAIALRATVLAYEKRMRSDPADPAAEFEAS